MEAEDLLCANIINKIMEKLTKSHDKSTKNIKKKYKYNHEIHKRIPSITHLKLTKDESEANMNQSLWKNMIGSVFYLIASRPGITFFVGVCARFQAKSKACHISQIKRILRYVNMTCDYGLLVRNQLNTS